MDLAFKSSTLWKFKAELSSVCLTSFSPNGIEADRAVYKEELVQITMSAVAQIQNQAAASRTFNVDNGGISFAIGKDAKKLDLLKGWKASDGSHKQHAKPQQDSIAIGV